MVYSAMKGLGVAAVNHKSPAISVSRGVLVEHAKQLEADKLLFVDTDMVFPADTLVRLIEAEKDIICCNYSLKRPPFTPVVNFPIGISPEREKVSECKSLASGILLIDMKVFEKLKYPYFLIPIIAPNQYVGEDVYFGRKAQQAGFSLYCENELSKSIGHIGATTYYLKRED